jgi:hypothetical protein
MKPLEPASLAMLVINTLPAVYALDVANLLLEVIQFLLDGSVFLGHLLEFLLPLITVLLEGLDFTLEVAGLDIGLA